MVWNWTPGENGSYEQASQSAANPQTARQYEPAFLQYKPGGGCVPFLHLITAISINLDASKNQMTF